MLKCDGFKNKKVINIVYIPGRGLFYVDNITASLHDIQEVYKSKRKSI